jgi:hypothetical protein
LSKNKIGQHFLDYVITRSQYLKEKAERAIDQIEKDEDLFLILGETSNSIAIIMKHMTGNMKSRWTDFLTADGEKPSRDRPDEFDRTSRRTREEIMKDWNEGWTCLLETLTMLRPSDLMKDVRIRKQRYTVLQAIMWQMSHYSQHVGQIIFLSKYITQDSWKYLTMPPDYRFYES